jgi:hypothetical protein
VVKEIAPHYIGTYELYMNINVLEYILLLLSTSYLKIVAKYYSAKSQNGGNVGVA